MSRREGQLRMYDQNIPDYDLFNSLDDELIRIASPPIKVYEFDVEATLEGRVSGLDDLYGEAEIINEDRLRELYKEGFDGEWDSRIVRDGEIFKPYYEVPGYYQEPAWTQELQRLGVENVEEELAINFNYQAMTSLLGREIKICDVIQTFRGKIYRAQDAYVADEVIGWKYIHYHVIARLAKGVDRIILPEASQEPPRQNW